MSNQPIIELVKARLAPGRPRKVRVRGVEESQNPNTMSKGTVRNGVTTREHPL